MDDGRIDRALLFGEVVDEPPWLSIRKGIGEAPCPIGGPKVGGLTHGVGVRVAAEHLHRVSQQGFVVEREAFAAGKLPELVRQVVERGDNFSVNDEEAPVDVENGSAADTLAVHQLDEFWVGAFPPVAAPVLGLGEVRFKCDVNWRATKDSQHVARVADEPSVGVQPDEVLVVEFADSVAEVGQFE